MYNTRQDKKYEIGSNENYSDKKNIGRRDFLGLAGKIGMGLAIAGMSLHSPHAYADSVYYGAIKGAKSPAYIVYKDVSAASKYQPAKDSVDYAKQIAKRMENISSAIATVATAGKYDVVVEKGDPVIKDYVDINPNVIKSLKEIEQK